MYFSLIKTQTHWIMTIINFIIFFQLFFFFIKTGGAAGVAIVMILVGVILTALVLFLYIKFSNKGGDDMTIKFSRQVDDE